MERIIPGVHSVDIEKESIAFLWECKQVRIKGGAQEHLPINLALAFIQVTMDIG